MRLFFLCAIGLAAGLVACDDTGGGSSAPESVIHDGMGWRTVATTDPPSADAGHFNNDTQPTFAAFLGDAGGRIHAKILVTALGANAPPFNAGWLSFAAEGEDHVEQHGWLPEMGDLQGVVDVGTHVYAWTDGPTLHRLRYVADSLEDTVVFEPTGIKSFSTLRIVGHANRALDVVTTQSTDAEAAALYLYNTPVLFTKAHDAATGGEYLVDRMEFVRARDVDRFIFSGGTMATYHPPGSPAYVFQLASYGGGPAPHPVVLHVFTPSEDPSRTFPPYGTLRALRTYEEGVTLDSKLELLETPTNAWVLLTDDVAGTWRLLRFDRSTAELTLEFSIPSPLAAPYEAVSKAITDDGALYVNARTPNDGTRDRKVVRIAGGAVTELWSASLPRNPDSFEMDGLYSAGARVYLAVRDQLPFKFTNDERTYKTARFSFITPDLDAVKTPSPPSPPPPALALPSCNPITNAPCAAGEACDAGPSRSGFTCAPVGAAGLCEPCDPEGGSFCGIGLTCRRRTNNVMGVVGTCEHLCCTDADCSPSPGSRCLNMPYTPVGTCTSYNGFDYVSQCTGIPSVAVSGGACVP